MPTSNRLITDTYEGVLRSDPVVLPVASELGGLSFGDDGDLSPLNAVANREAVIATEPVTVAFDPIKEADEKLPRREVLYTEATDIQLSDRVGHLVSHIHEIVQHPDDQPIPCEVIHVTSDLDPKEEIALLSRQPAGVATIFTIHKAGGIEEKVRLWRQEGGHPICTVLTTHPSNSGNGSGIRILEEVVGSGSHKITIEGNQVVTSQRIEKSGDSSALTATDVEDIICAIEAALVGDVYKPSRSARLERLRSSVKRHIGLVAVSSFGVAGTAASIASQAIH